MKWKGQKKKLRKISRTYSKTRQRTTMKAKKKKYTKKLKNRKTEKMLSSRRSIQKTQGQTIYL